MGTHGKRLTSERIHNLLSYNFAVYNYNSNNKISCSREILIISFRRVSWAKVCF